MSCWKAREPPYRPTIFNAPDSTHSYSSIAAAMLSRAAKDFEPSHPKKDLTKQLLPSSNPVQNGNIQEQFKKARQSSQSIGGFTGFTNSSNSLSARSSNVKQDLKRKSTSFSTPPSTTGLASVLSKQDSFRSTPDTINLIREDLAGPKPLPGVQNVVGFDENDFDDDDDIDLDMDFEIPMSMAAPPKPSQQKPAVSQSPYTLPQLSRSHSRPEPSRNPTSSLQTWSSSSPSHKMTPPGALERRQREGLAARELPMKDADPNPRPVKRRTYPWPQRHAEEDDIAAKKEEREEMLAARATSNSSPTIFCFRCRKEGHYINQCPNQGKAKGTEWDYTPQLKDKSFPWNTTASAVKEQRKAFQEKKKAARKIDDAALEAVEKHTHAKVAMGPISLSEEQRRVLDLVANQQKSVFFTGSAGTGKSVLMRAIITELRKKYGREPDRIAVTASTGLAACNIGGVTLHSFGGIGLGKEDVPALVKKIRRNQKAKNRWIRTKILIIDEISMVDGELFDKLEGIARAMRNNGRPFGGIQLVITGDFFQLPPVPDFGNKSREVKFAFDAGTWSTAIHHTIGLTEVFRQKDPGIFSNWSLLDITNMNSLCKYAERDATWQDHPRDCSSFPQT